MDYQLQSAFFQSQRRLSLLLGLPAILLLSITPWIPLPWLAPHPLFIRIVSTLLSLLLSSILLMDLPSYLSLDANPRRRLRWLEKPGLPFLLAFLGLALGFAAWLALIPTATAAILHFAMHRHLNVSLPLDPTAASHVSLARFSTLALLIDLLILLALAFSGVPAPLLIPLFALSAFLAAVTFRFHTVPSALWYGFAISVASLALWLNPLSATGLFLFTLTVTLLLARADRQNIRNFETLVSDLQEFRPVPRRQIVHLLSSANDELIADWHRATPKGPAELSAWYSRNALNYLFANTQHHLLHRHITYTLGLLSLARGRVLDFGGGPGNFSLALARRGFDVTYLDVPGESADYLRWQAARHDLPITIAHDLSTLRGPFDSLFALDVLEHIENVRETLALWSNLLSPAARLIATYYNGPVSSAPMHLDPGFDAKALLLTSGFRDVRPQLLSTFSPSFSGIFSPALLHKSHFFILEKLP